MNDMFRKKVIGMYKIDCKKVREEMLEEAKEKINKIHKELNRKLKIVVIQVKGDLASVVYIRNKVKTCESVGIDCEVLEFPSDISYKELESNILSHSLDDNVDGVILQLPLPDHLKPYQNQLINTIDGRKDVDGLTDYNVMKLWTDQDGIRPATAEGILRLLPEDLSYKTVSIYGRSNLVGKPLIKMLMDRNATVTVYHSKSAVLTDYLLYTKESDIVISAIGKPKYLKALPSMASKTIFIDVGINRDSDGKLCGDFDFQSDGFFTYTPVPGGVGVLTTAQLVLNLIKCYEMKKGK